MLARCVDAAFSCAQVRERIGGMLTHASLLRLCEARDRLRDPDDAAGVAGMARALGMSTGHFIRQFAAVFGMTPHQCRTAARIERARHLLALDRQSVTDICMELGFSSLGSFSTLFARRVGVSPSDYRRRVRPLVVVPGRLPPALRPGCLSLMAQAYATLRG